jgi:hypothetical protein
MVFMKTQTVFFILGKLDCPSILHEVLGSGWTPTPKPQHCCLSFEAPARFSFSVVLRQQILKKKKNQKTKKNKKQTFYLGKKGVFYIFNCLSTMSKARSCGLTDSC